MASKKNTHSSLINTPLNIEILKQLGVSFEKPTKGKKTTVIDMADLTKSDPDDPKLTREQALTKSVLSILGKDEVVRLAFERDPTSTSEYQSLYKSKLRLCPDKLLKRIAIQDDLVAAIVLARQQQISVFGAPRADRFTKGFEIELRKEDQEKVDSIEDTEQKKKVQDDIQKRIAAVTKRIMSCGDEDALGEEDTLTFPEYLSQSVRNAVVVGRLATEIIYKTGHDGKPAFSCFRVIDAGTIYRATPQRAAAEQLRQQARHLLEQIKNAKLEPERYQNDEYTWVQVIDERPVQAFTSKECLVHNFYRVPDIELDGYPVTPLDTVLSAVTTHINITTHNKLYFQSGRATRGMLVINSDDVDDAVISRIRQTFNASINGTNNAWRMPVFGMGSEDTITWQPIDSGGRDMEFQYLMDQNARVIMTAFMIGPEELPGWSYLSRGTAAQSLAESNNEWKLEASRDLGIRPILARFEDFLNHHILPLFDPVLAKMAVIKLLGLDAETPEKESVRLTQDMPIHMTMDEVLGKVEKDPIGKEWGGDFLFNAAWQAIIDKYLTVGEIKERFFGMKGASKDPQWAYCRDEYWFKQVQLIMQQQQMQAQAQAQQQQAAQGGQPGQPPPDDGSGGSAGGAPQGQPDGSEGAQGPSNGPAQTENQKTQAQEESSASPTDLTRSIDQALVALSKSEAQLPNSKRRLLNRQKLLLKEIESTFDQDSKESVKEILDIATKFAPKKKA